MGWVDDFIREGDRPVRVSLRTVDKDGNGLEDQDSYDDKLWLSGYNSYIEYADEDWYEGYVSVGKDSELIIVYGFEIPDDWDKPGFQIEFRVEEYDLQGNEVRSIIENVPLVNGCFATKYKTKKLD
jgi:hypothetical protein